MRVALVSCGPSVTYTWKREFFRFYDKLMVVSRALPLCDLTTVDIWAAGEVFRNNQLPSPSLMPTVWPLEHSVVITESSDFGHARQRGYINLIDSGLWQPAPWLKRLFTTPAALNWLCYSYRPEIVHCYGCDMSGCGYYNGVSMSSTIEANERWGYERQAFNKVKEIHPYTTISRVLC